MINISYKIFKCFVKNYLTFFPNFAAKELLLGTPLKASFPLITTPGAVVNPYFATKFGFFVISITVYLTFNSSNIFSTLVQLVQLGVVRI